MSENSYYCVAELRELSRMAENYLSSSKFSRCKYLYRNKSKKYFQNIMSGNGKMKLMLKDGGADPRSPININLKGIFFSASVEPSSIDAEPRSVSAFGKSRISISISVLARNKNLYFSDFYCMGNLYKNQGYYHYVTLVLTSVNSNADKFCNNFLMPLNWTMNPYLYRESKEFYVVDKKELLVEVFFTEVININVMISKDLAFISHDIEIIGKGHSTNGGKKKNSDCLICNIPEKTINRYKFIQKPTYNDIQNFKISLCPNRPKCIQKEILIRDNVQPNTKEKYKKTNIQSSMQQKNTIKKEIQKDKHLISHKNKNIAKSSLDKEMVKNTNLLTNKMTTTNINLPEQSVANKTSKINSDNKENNIYNKSTFDKNNIDELVNDSSKCFILNDSFNLDLLQYMDDNIKILHSDNKGCISDIDKDPIIYNILCEDFNNPLMTCKKLDQNMITINSNESNLPNMNTPYIFSNYNKHSIDDCLNIERDNTKNKFHSTKNEIRIISDSNYIEPIFDTTFIQSSSNTTHTVILKESIPEVSDSYKQNNAFVLIETNKFQNILPFQNTFKDYEPVKKTNEKNSKLDPIQEISEVESLNINDNTDNSTDTSHTIMVNDAILEVNNEISGPKNAYNLIEPNNFQNNLKFQNINEVLEPENEANKNYCESNPILESDDKLIIIQKNTNFSTNTKKKKVPTATLR